MHQKKTAAIAAAIGLVAGINGMKCLEALNAPPVQGVAPVNEREQKALGTLTVAQEALAQSVQIIQDQQTVQMIEQHPELAEKLRQAGKEVPTHDTVRERLSDLAKTTSNLGDSVNALQLTYARDSWKLAIDNSPK